MTVFHVRLGRYYRGLPNGVGATVRGNGYADYLLPPVRQRPMKLWDVDTFRLASKGSLVEHFFVYLGYGHGEAIMDEMLEWYGDLHTMYIVVNGSTIAYFKAPALSIEILVSKKGLTLARPKVTAFSPTV